MKALPFNGYTWNFSQHAIALQPSNLFSLLSAASLFEGQSGFGNSINKLLISNNVLTSNIRNGKPDAWRDYQQILAETGLIVSTKLERNLRITEAGRLLLSGEIGVSELMSIQALRYQYPNGLKNAFFESQYNSGILIKPGVLILRILLELYKNGIEPKISIDQCQNYLLPIIRNDDWLLAYQQIRNNDNPSSLVNRHARRNIQDWFKFLNVTNIFEILSTNKQSYITLTSAVKSRIDFYNSICSYSESPNTFWIPTSLDNSFFLSWFRHFGHIPTEYFKLLEEELTDVYLNQNYFEIPEEIDDDNVVKKGKNIILSEVPEDGIEVFSTFNDCGIEEKVNSGFIKRREKTKLHDEIINQLVFYYRAKGYKVFDDKQSVDLLIKSEQDEISIFEVKTATLRNIFQRSRLAVGQVLEYSYRYNLDYGVNPQKNLVFNIDMAYQSWLKQYINGHLNIGLISVLGDDIKIFPPHTL